MAVRIRFDATLETRSELGVFPANIVHTVILSNRDDCTYQIVPVTADGKISVSYDMQSNKDTVRMTDRIKIFFYYKKKRAAGQLLPICAGHMPLLQLAKLIAEGGEHTTACNFTSNQVILKIKSSPSYSHTMHCDLLDRVKNHEIVESVLSRSAEHAQTIDLLCQHIQRLMPTEMLVSPDNGGTIFQSLDTMHVMSGEKTILPLYHLDFEQPDSVPLALATYLMLATLHFKGVTIEQVDSMSGNALTDFLAAYAQAPMRSVKAVPYTSDETMTDNPKARHMSVLSEVFKRTCSYPCLEGCLLADDCEGFAGLIRLMICHLGYMFKTYTPRFESNNLPTYSSLMKESFPPELFPNISMPYQAKLMKMMLKLGQIVADDKIACAIVLGTANAASAGCADQTKVSGHAYACMINKDPFSPYTVILEGTTCMVDDQMPKMLKMRDRCVSVSDVVNSISCSSTFNTFMGEGYETQVAMHITHDKSSFYRAAFLQNDTLLGTVLRPGASSGHPGKENLMYGVDIEHLTNDNVKVYMPVTGKIFENGEYQRLKEYVIARQVEIHPPLLSPKDLMAGLKWVPLSPFKGVDRLRAGRQYTTLMVHVLATEEHPWEQLLVRATREAEAFNADPKNLRMGVMHAYASMDGVSKVLHLYTDDTTELESRLARAQQ